MFVFYFQILQNTWTLDKYLAFNILGFKPFFFFKEHLGTD
jgi:hypothetical protein